MDRLFLEVIELMLMAGYASRDRKLPIIQQASTKLDALKFFLRLMWQANALNETKYAAISAPVFEIGKMLGGWRRQLINE